MMITTKEVLQRFEETATYYIQELERFNLEQLKQKPSENSLVHRTDVSASH